MRAYIKNFNLSIQSQLQFRANFMISFFTGFLFDYVKVAIWYAIMLFQVERLHPTVIQQTLRYMILTSSLSLLFKSFGQEFISEKIINGSIERDMLYPVSVIWLHFSSGLGSVVVEFFRTSCITFLILSLLYSVSWSFQIVPFIGMFLLLILGLIIQYLILVAIDLVSFWIFESRSLHGLWDATYKFLGGFLMPLWFFPEKLQTIMDYLPFKNIVNIPVVCFITNYSVSQIIKAALISLAWIGVLLIVVNIQWRLGTRKLMIQGG